MAISDAAKNSLRESLIHFLMVNRKSSFDLVLILLLRGILGSLKKTKKRHKKD